MRAQQSFSQAAHTVSKNLAGRRRTRAGRLANAPSVLWLSATDGLQMSRPIDTHVLGE